MPLGSLGKDARDAYGNTPLHYAAISGHEEAIRFLFENGAQLEAFNEFGHTPIFMAAAKGHFKCITLLKGITFHYFK